MTDFRALCAELLMALENAISIIYCEDGTKHISTAKPIVNRARSALADEPASVVSEPSDEEIMELWHGSDRYNEGATLREFLSIARAVLARWGTPNLAETRSSLGDAPQPPADKEVAELARLLRLDAEFERSDGVPQLAAHFDRAADLLQRQYPQPVPTSERLPGPGDCLDEGWAWFFHPRIGWRQAVLPVTAAYTHWLPAHALPLPTAND